MSLINITYSGINLTDDGSNYNEMCFLKQGEGLSNDTSIVYKDLWLDIGSVISFTLAVIGVLLNSLTIITLLCNAHIRKERFTPFIVSIATCDLLFSATVLPINGIRFYYRYNV